MGRKLHSNERIYLKLSSYDSLKLVELRGKFPSINKLKIGDCFEGEYSFNVSVFFINIITYTEVSNNKERSMKTLNDNNNKLELVNIIIHAIKYTNGEYIDNRNFHIKVTFALQVNVIVKE